MAIVGGMIFGSLLCGVANMGSSYIGGLAQEKIEKERNEANLKLRSCREKVMNLLLPLGLLA